MELLSMLPLSVLSLLSSEFTRGPSLRELGFAPVL